MSTDFTIAEFLSFCRSKPAEEHYCYASNGNCALARFLIETGRADNPNVGGGPLCEWDDKQGVAHTFDEALDVALECRPNTFGALVTRLEKLVQEAPVKPSLWLNPQTYVDADVGEMVK